ncbi:helix-turn-helix domain-containing protein [Streptomyces sp. NPDC059679]|uniref:helix-turn-helix domain-containing protein n=1 Tax=Streptomyces sp. NPDC059679 TaxID=3346903 RepID=UPI003692487C
MRVRADIVALINAGLDDDQIAEELHCHRTTPYRVRRALAEASLNVAARVLAEELPTGQVRDYRPARMPTSPAQAAANRARLLAALSEPPAHDTESEAA